LHRLVYFALFSPSRPSLSLLVRVYSAQEWCNFHLLLLKTFPMWIHIFVSCARTMIARAIEGYKSYRTCVYKYSNAKDLSKIATFLSICGYRCCANISAQASEYCFERRFTPMLCLWKALRGSSIAYQVFWTSVNQWPRPGNDQTVASYLRLTQENSDV